MGTKILMPASDPQGRGRKHPKQVLGHRPTLSEDALDPKPDQQLISLRLPIHSWQSKPQQTPISKRRRKILRPLGTIGPFTYSVVCNVDTTSWGKWKGGGEWGTRATTTKKTCLAELPFLPLMHTAFHPQFGVSIQYSPNTHSIKLEISHYTKHRPYM